jgi:hypothetical protein
MFHRTSRIVNKRVINYMFGTVARPRRTFSSFTLGCRYSRCRRLERNDTLLHVKPRIGAVNTVAASFTRYVDDSTFTKYALGQCTADTLLCLQVATGRTHRHSSASKSRSSCSVRDSAAFEKSRPVQTTTTTKTRSAAAAATSSSIDRRNNQNLKQGYARGLTRSRLGVATDQHVQSDARERGAQKLQPVLEPRARTHRLFRSYFSR